VAGHEKKGITVRGKEKEGEEGGRYGKGIQWLADGEGGDCCMSSNCSRGRHVVTGKKYPWSGPGTNAGDVVGGERLSFGGRGGNPGEKREAWAKADRGRIAGVGGDFWHGPAGKKQKQRKVLACRVGK